MNEDDAIFSAIITSRNELNVDLDQQMLGEIVGLEMHESDAAKIEKMLLNIIDNAISRGVRGSRDGGVQ